MFNTFKNKEERCKFGGTSFIELQYCRLNTNTKLKKIVAVNSIHHWKEDSLYVRAADINEFRDNYSNIFNIGTYNNMKTGIVDVYGINYYSVKDLKYIVDKITNDKPQDYDKLVSWLKEGLQYNGFYILGI